MSRPKKKRKKFQQKAAKQNASKKAKPAAPVIVPATPVIVASSIFRPDAEFVSHVRAYGVHMLAASRARSVDACRESLDQALACLKAANKLVPDGPHKLKRTVIKQAKAELTEAERKLKIAAEQRIQALNRRYQNMLAAYEAIGIKTDKPGLSEEDLLLQLRLQVIDWTAGKSKSGLRTARRLVSKVKTLLPDLDYSEVEHLTQGYFRKRPGTDKHDVYVRLPGMRAA